MVNNKTTNIILFNLIQNAIHSMPGGGTIFISFENKNTRVILKIKDAPLSLRNSRKRNYCESIYWIMMIIAIDGPAGSGKSTVAKMLAKKLGFLYIDTGAMYRALTLKAMRQNIDMHNSVALTEMANSSDVKIVNGAGCDLLVQLDGENVADKIRTPELTANIAFIANVPCVRGRMVALQRGLAEGNSCVLEGRDIGTVVFPNADFKFYLDASFDERVNRRLKELKLTDANLSADAVRDDLKVRDNKDFTRPVGALKIADGAIVVDTTKLTINGVVDKLYLFVTTKQVQ